MSGACTAAEAPAGVAVLISGYLDCQARELGANGFQALAGGALGAGLLSGLLTIFVALIGYRFILGEAPGLRQGVGWTVRLGLVLALVTGWPAFQALIYDVAIEGPREMAGIMLPASGLPSEQLDARMQSAYDTIRLGTADPEPGSAEAAAAEEGMTRPGQRYHFQPPLPRTASLFVLSTLGFEGALRIAAGFLLAIAPLAIMSLLFDATLGVFSGWVRALGGVTLATLAATVVTALGLVLVEAELARLQALRFAGSAQPIDPQGLSVIVILFALIAVVTVGAAMRVMGAFRLPLSRSPERTEEVRVRNGKIRSDSAVPQPVQMPMAQALAPVQPRVSSIVQSLSSSARRDQFRSLASSGFGGSAAHSQPVNPAGEVPVLPHGAARRRLGRQTRTSALRDRKQR